MSLNFPISNQLKISLAALIIITGGLVAFTEAVKSPKELLTGKAALSGDCNSDNRVDILDFQLLSNTFGKSSGQSGYNGLCDFNTNGSIDILDFQILANNFGMNGSGTPTPTIRIPTPTAIPGGNSNPLTDCSGYNNPKRIFLETQAWWMDTNSITGPVPPGQTPLNGIGGHAHTATCFPQDQMIPDGDITFNVRLMLHKGQVGQVTILDIGLGPSGTSLARKSFSPNLNCPGGSDLSVMCEMWIPITLRVDSRIPAGYQELRFRYKIRQPNGEEQFASTGWNAYFHGNTSNHYRNIPFLEARGWYTGTEYENAQLTNPISYTPISGVVTFRGAMKPGSGGIAVADHGVHIDARFNRDDFGRTILRGSGSFSGSFTLDTRQLTNGVHCLALRTSSVNHNGGTDTGILQFPIWVNNPGSPSGNGSGGCAPGT